MAYCYRYLLDSSSLEFVCLVVAVRQITSFQVIVYRAMLALFTAEMLAAPAVALTTLESWKQASLSYPSTLGYIVGFC